MNLNSKSSKYGRKFWQPGVSNDLDTHNTRVSSSGNTPPPSYYKLSVKAPLQMYMTSFKGKVEEEMNKEN